MKQQIEVRDLKWSGWIEDTSEKFCYAHANLSYDDYYQR